MKKILDKIPDPAKLYGGWVVNDNVPIVKDIVGAEIPEVGSKEVILYISEGGENWDKGVRFVVSKDGKVKATKFNPNPW